MAKANIMRAVIKAPKNAAKGSRAGWLGKSTEQAKTKKPAPLFIPMMFGLAKGFCSTACMIVPATARALPANKAPSTRGKRLK